MLSQVDFAGIAIDELKQFFTTLSKIIDNRMVKQRPVVQEGSKQTDYSDARLVNDEPKGGWISSSELAAQHQKMVEALKRENWTEGFVIAIKLLGAVG